MFKVSLIVPCLNHFDYTKKCLASIYKNTDMSDIELIVVDDGSSDETSLSLPEYLDYNYKIIRHWPKNIGFGPSVNHGIRCATGDFIAVFNNDMLVGKKWLDNILDAFEKTDYYMITSLLIGSESCSPEEFQSYSEEACDVNDNNLHIWSKGGPWVFKRECFSMVGYFDEVFKYGEYEDTDYLVRMALAKMKWGMLHTSVAFHYGSITQFGELKDRLGNNDYIKRNAEKFRQKWGTAHITPEKLQIWYDGGTPEPDGM